MELSRRSLAGVPGARLSRSEPYFTATPTATLRHQPSVHRRDARRTTSRCTAMDIDGPVFVGVSCQVACCGVGARRVVGDCVGDSAALRMARLPAIPLRRVHAATLEWVGGINFRPVRSREGHERQQVLLDALKQLANLRATAWGRGRTSPRWRRASAGSGALRAP